MISWTFSWYLQSVRRMLHTKLWCVMMTNTICFCNGTNSFTFNNICLYQYCIIKSCSKDDYVSSIKSQSYFISLHQAFIWNGDQCNLLLHYNLVTFKNICLRQYYAIKRCDGDDQVSSIWSQSFFYKSAIAELHERVDSK